MDAKSASLQPATAEPNRTELKRATHSSQCPISVLHFLSLTAALTAEMVSLGVSSGWVGAANDCASRRLPSRNCCVA